MHPKHHGFTLIELLIVVAIIAILAAIAVPNFLEAQTRSKVSRARADLRSVATGLESYAVDNNKYPPNLGQDGGSNNYDPQNLTNGYGSVRTQAWRAINPRITTPIAYMTSIPADPFKLGATNISDSATPDADQNKPYATANSLDVAFIYQNIQEFAFPSPSPPLVAQAGYGIADVNDYGAWRLMSNGPDRHYNRIGDSSILKLGWIYDPTNGTVSGGMVIRTANQTQVTISH